jgi:hypothetical protein
MPIQSLQEAVPDEKDLEDDTHHDLGRAAAEATVETTVGEQPAAGIRAIVQFDYEKAEDNEIELREGEQVTEIEMVDKDWWLGVNVRGERGLFPGNYVEIVEDGDQEDAAAGHHAPEPVAEPEPEPVAAPVQEAAAPNGGSHNPTATALYDYEAAEDNELSFPEGAKIVNVVCASAAIFLFFYTPHSTSVYLMLTRNIRNSPTTTGGLENTMVPEDSSRLTMLSWINETPAWRHEELPK